MDFKNENFIVNNFRILEVFWLHIKSLPCVGLVVYEHRESKEVGIKIGMGLREHDPTESDNVREKKEVATIMSCGTYYHPKTIEKIWKTIKHLSYKKQSWFK